MAGSSSASLADYRQALDDPESLHEFRVFLRRKLDMNRSSDTEVKRKFEQWLDFVLICQKVFSLAEDEEETRLELMTQIGEKFLAKPPLGYNIAFANQLNRKELVQHCKNLKERVSLEPDTSLLRPGYEYIYSSLSKKYDVFRKTRPRTALHTLLCALS